MELLILLHENRFDTAQGILIIPYYCSDEFTFGKLLSRLHHLFRKLSIDIFSVP